MVYMFIIKKYHADKFVLWTLLSKILEVLLIRIQREIIQFSGRLKKEKEKNEKLLILLNEIELLETGNLQLNSSLLKLRLDKLKGTIVRSRAKWLEEGEIQTKYFSELESKKLFK